MQNETAKPINNSLYKKKTALILFIAVLFLIFDRFLKILSMTSSSDIKLIKDVFLFTLEKNYFIAFSLPFSGSILHLFIFLIISLLLIYAYHSYKKGSSEIFPIFFVLAGAISNLFDRLRFGCVVDYFYLKHFTIFNIADCLIFFGVVVLLRQAHRQLKK